MGVGTKRPPLEGGNGATMTRQNRLRWTVTEWMDCWLVEDVHKRYINSVGGCLLVVAGWFA